MATLQTIYHVLNEIRDMVTAIILNARINPDQIDIETGLSDIDFRLGLLQAGEFRTGNGREPGSGFSGMRIGYPAFTYSSEEWNLVGVSNDAIQFGVRASDGTALFGGGIGILNANGISLYANESGIDETVSWYKFLDSTGDPFAGMHAEAVISGAALLWLMNCGIDHGYTSAQTFIGASGPSGSQQGLIRIASIAAGDSLISINAGFDDFDFMVLSSLSSTPMIWGDAGLNAVGIGGAAESGYKLKVTGLCKFTDFNSFSAYRNAAQSINDVTLTKVQFDTEEYDTGGFYDNATNYRFTPTVAGKYQIHANVVFAAAGGQVFATAYKNGTRFKDGNVMANDATASASSVVSCEISLNGTSDYVEIFAYQSSGGSLALGVGGPAYTYFQASLAR